MSRLGDALRPAVARAAAEARKAVLDDVMGRFYPVSGVQAFFEVGGLISPSATTFRTLRARGMIPDGPSLPDYVAGDIQGGAVPAVFDALLARAVGEGPERLADAWEENMLCLIEAGVVPDELRLAVDEALARLVMSS